MSAEEGHKNDQKTGVSLPWEMGETAGMFNQENRKVQSDPIALSSTWKGTCTETGQNFLQGHVVIGKGEWLWT